MSFSDEERAELIAALSRTAEMVGLLLDALDVLLVSYVAGQQPRAGDHPTLRELVLSSRVARTVVTRRSAWLWCHAVVPRPGEAPVDRRRTSRAPAASCMED